MKYLNNFTEFILEETDPKVGTGKKPKGSTRRLYTDENPKDTVPVKFRTLEDIRSTINSPSFKSKSHKRQSQILNLIEQRVRVAHSRAKDADTKRRLKRAHDYIKSKCEASKEKTKRLKESIEIDSEKSDSILQTIATAKVTPKTDKVLISKLYDLIFVQSSDVIEIDNGGPSYTWGDSGRFLTLDFNHIDLHPYTCWSFITSHPTLDEAITKIDPDRFSQKVVKAGLVNLLDYNQINFQELENIFMDFGIQVENIWVWDSNLNS